MHVYWCQRIYVLLKSMHLIENKQFNCIIFIKKKFLINYNKKTAQIHHSTFWLSIKVTKIMKLIR